MIREAIEKLVSGKSLSINESESVMEEIMEGKASDSQFGAFVTALRLKGEVVDELVGMTRIMRNKSLKVQIEGPLLDTCGTGGDGSTTFNISTTSAFVAAGAGIKVAKHGNRAMSSNSGSADILESLGARIDLQPQDVKQCLEETGFGFFFAQSFHPSMRHAAAPRREIGIRTIFNFLGPLTNPANAKFQLLGVSDKNMAIKMIKVLKALGSEGVMVVCGHESVDELTTHGPSEVWELKDGAIESYDLKPEQLGVPFSPLKTIKVQNVTESLAMLQSVLDGQKGPARDIVLINSAAALSTIGHASDLKEGLIMSADSIDSGKAADALKSFIGLTQKF